MKGWTFMSLLFSWHMSHVLVLELNDGLIGDMILS